MADLKQAAIQELARRELERRGSIQPIAEKTESPLIAADEMNIMGEFYTPQQKVSPLEQAKRTGLRGLSALTGGVVPGGEFTVKKPELAGRTAGAVLAPVGSATGLVGEFVGKQLAPEGKEGVGQAIGGIAGGLLGEGTVGLARGVAKGSAARVINSMIKPQKSTFKYGKNPGKTVSDLGIVGNSFEDLGNNISTALETKMDDLAGALKGTSKKINFKDAIAVLDDTIDDLSLAKGSNKSIIDKVQTFKDDLIALTRGKSGKFKSNLQSLTPEEAVKMKRITGKQAKWTGGDAPPDFQKMLHKVYHKMRTAIEDVVPQSKKINEDIAGLIGAKNAIEGAVARSQKQTLPFKFKDLATLGLGTYASGGNPLVGLSLMGAEKALATPITGTRIASQLSKFGANKGRLLTGLLK